CVRKADEADVGEETQLETHLARFTRETGLHAPRRLVRRGREPGIAAPAATTAGDDDLGIGMREIGHELAGRDVEYASPDRHAYDPGRTGGAGLLLPTPMLAALGFEVALEAEVEECRQAGIGAEDDVAARAAVAPARAAMWAVFLAQERDAAAAAVAGL